MQLRSATAQDKPAIITLLKSSLGESMIPKSESLWTWKHEQNPFGPSFVLLAEEDNELIGVRAFMQWAWQWGDKTYKAIRAVDTATHPDHQGKGIFKKLTLKQLELCKEQGIHFVFNTPNDQSRPGYLKMGWVAQGRMPLKMQPVQPLTTALNVLLKKQKAVPTLRPDNWEPALKLIGQKTALPPAGLHTVVSKNYIDWRYASNPLFPYYCISDNENYLLILRPKPHTRFLELRITDFFVFNDAESIRRSVREQLKKKASEMNADIVSISGNIYTENRKHLGSMGLIPVRASGPIVTLRDLNVSDQFGSLLETPNWSYSLGDLELF
ncbi:MAG: GNAT family N-acetyltransferase [Sphingobacteriales bacterium]|nr:MAG: GNAT family N-acetyltransferase [Sphingobacteriales bacterium]